MFRRRKQQFHVVGAATHNAIKNTNDGVKIQIELCCCGIEDLAADKTM